MSEEDANKILVDVLKSHKKYQLIGVDNLYTLKIEINKRIKKYESKNPKLTNKINKESLAIYLLLKAPLEEVIEYVDDTYLQPIILWRMKNEKIPHDENRKQQEAQRLKKSNIKRNYIAWDRDTGTQIESDVIVRKRPYS